MTWNILKDKAKDEGIPLQTVVGEALHLVVLDTVFSAPESSTICFQGGTSIHFLYGGYRYSEGLDFAGKDIDFQSSRKLMNRAKAGIEKNITQLLGTGQFRWRLPSAETKLPIYTYWMSFEPKESRQSYRVKMEFAGYPVYQRKVMPVKSDLDVLERRPLVLGLTVSKLIAEKVTAVAGRSYLKGRDLFDLWYLTDVMGGAIDKGLVEKKFYDCNVLRPCLDIKKRIDNIGKNALEREMDRFLPQRYRSMLSWNGYKVILDTALSVLSSAVGSHHSEERNS
jgi:predicted nucleotidyltransferase component of viral defense system